MFECHSSTMQLPQPLLHLPLVASYHCVMQDKRWYIQPGNFSKEGCIYENMSAGGGPTRRLLTDSKHHDCNDLFSPVRHLTRVETLLENMSPISC